MVTALDGPTLAKILTYHVLPTQPERGRAHRRQLVPKPRFTTLPVQHLRA